MNYKYMQGWTIIFLVLISFFAIAGTPYTPNFSIYNESDLGASHFFDEISKFEYNTSRLLISPIILNVNKGIETIVIIGSERTYTGAEIDAYEDFVDRGGMLIIFEDFGPAKKIASKMGVSLLPGILREPTVELQINRPTQFFVQDLIISQFLEGVTFPPLLVSEAVSVVDFLGFSTGQTLPLLMTFPNAFLDVNNNNAMEITDLNSPVGMPLGVMKLYGNGTLVVLGDSSLPLNRNWQRHVTLFGQDYILPNAWWVLMLISTLMQTNGKTNIVFDESHQAIQFDSGAGILNLIAGTWVGIWNTLQVALILSILTFFITSNRVRAKIKGRRRFRRVRDTNIAPIEDEKNLSNPTYAENGIIQQYILYQVMEDNFVHVANSNLISKLEASGKADEFLEEMKRKYRVNSLTDAMTFDKLLDLHNDLRQFVEENASKWLR